MDRSKELCTIFFNLLVLSFAREQWIDPHDMAVKKGFEIASGGQNKIINTDKKFLLQETTENWINNENNACNCQQSADASLIHYRRTLSIFLNALKMDQQNADQYKGVININIPINDYNFLQNFIQSPVEDVAQLRKVNSILEGVFSRTVFQRTSDNLMAWFDWFYFTFYNHTTGITILGFVIAWLSCKLIKANWTPWRVVKTLVFFAWIVDFAFTWIHLIQEEEIGKVADSLKYVSLPAACDPNKMNWFQYAWSFISDNSECKNYHRAMLENIFWKVSPFTVFAHQFGVVIATPANNIGRAFGALTSGMLDELPFGIKFIILPILLIFFIVAVCILLSFLTNTSFQINLLHLINLQIGEKQRHMIGHLFSGPIEIIQREAIETVRNSNRPKEKQLKEKPHSSNENRMQIEDVADEKSVDLEDERKMVATEPQETTQTNNFVEDLKQDREEVDRKQVSTEEKSDV